MEEGRPEAAAEGYLTLARRQVYARAGGQEQGYSLEAPAHPPVEGLIAAARLLAEALLALCEPFKQLRRLPLARLDDAADKLHSDTPPRLEAADRSPDNRPPAPLAARRERTSAV